MVKLYVEGGGDSNELKTACRQGFTQFITAAGINKRPRVVACGSRRDAYESYCTALANGESAMLLVDSEQAVNSQNQTGAQNAWLPWSHLQSRDGWRKPEGAIDTDCHLMVQVMESWFIADRKTLENFFGQNFNANVLPSEQRPIEEVSKQQVYQALENATKDCKKGKYGKGSHSFKILKEISPALVQQASGWAARFINELKNKMDA
ncbi:DUF4276 family protein [Hahella chejuensis]|uniref:DUF4276 family protein n=1 Tax=Hahella chejuensis TaxID=158327 RepID=UPI0005A26D0C|nr:DUF4276 family protein [Hahella chejuensis]